MSDERSVSHWIDEVKAGNSLAAREIWQRYYQRLVGMARQRLRGRQRQLADEEDIAISVFESFYRAAENGRFPDLSGRDDLWRLLLRMAARKIIDQQRRNETVRRGGEETIQPIVSKSPDGEDAIIQVIGDDPSPDMVLMMTESCEELLEHLGDETLQKIAIAKMEGYSNAEIAEQLGRSERTIERRLHLIREKCQQEILDDDD